MKILFFYPPILPTRGGVQRVTENLADEFEKHGHTVFYLSPTKNLSVSADEYSPRQYFLSNSNLKSVSTKIELLDFLKNKQIDIVISQCGFSSKSSRFLYCVRELNIPLISVCHTTLLGVPLNYRAIKGNFFLKKLLLWPCDTKIGKKILLQFYKFKYQKHFKELCKNSDRVVLLSEYFKPELAFFLAGKIVPANVVAIGNAVPTKMCEIDFPQKKKELLSVGRFDGASKKQNYLLKIWSRLEKSFPDWSLRLLGDGKELDKMKSLAKRLGLEQVYFEGHQVPENYYRNASIYCMTSAYEGFPMALAEAVSFGCVPVAFDSFASVHDIITDGENGMIVPAFDLDKYVQILAKLMREHDLRERLAHAALRAASRFSPENIFGQWEQVFKELTKK